MIPDGAVKLKLPEAVQNATALFINFEWSIPGRDLTDASAITGHKRNLETNDTFVLDGTFTATSPNTVRWQPSEADVGTHGNFAVQLRAVFNGGHAATLQSDWYVEPALDGVEVDAEGVVGVTVTQRDALDAANEPSGANPVATIADLAGNIPLIDPATAGNLVTVTPGGELEDAGYGADDLITRQEFPGPTYRVDFINPVSGKKSSIFIDADGGLVFTSDAKDILFDLGQLDLTNPDNTENSNIRAVSNGTGLPRFQLLHNGNLVSIEYEDLHWYLVDFSNNRVVRIHAETGVWEFLGANADANRTAQRREILAADQQPEQVDIAGVSHTFATTNEGAIVASQSGDPTIFTIPLNSAQAFPVGSIVGIERQGAGTLAITATAGVTLNGVDGASKSLSEQWGAAALRKIGTNSWIIIGSLS